MSCSYILLDPEGEKFNESIIIIEAFLNPKVIIFIIIHTVQYVKYAVVGPNAK